MYPELFKLPFINTTVKSYGLMMVIGFLCALWLIRRLSRSFLADPQLITNIALYAMIAGVVGARLFHIIHYYDDKFRTHPIEILYIWQGGLEFYGGVIMAVTVILIYLLYYKLPVRQCMDVLAIGLMLALAFGRIGCFLNGCCFGKPANLPWAVRFPAFVKNLAQDIYYPSFVFDSQVYPDFKRGRTEPRLKLPDEYFENSANSSGKYLKPYEDLTIKQQMEVTEGKYRPLAVHPTQLYESVAALFLCLVALGFWRRSQKALQLHNEHKPFVKPGIICALMFIMYGIVRFCLEYLRDDNPYEFDGITISQNISIAMIVLGVVLVVVFERMKLKPHKS
jgi:phosphatidylglycerol---prolipoprotein diacylglyceryl transferase